MGKSAAGSALSTTFFYEEEERPRRFFRQMLTIRLFEERLLKLFSEGKLSGTTHTCIGQEANAVGVINALDRSRDLIWSNHRCHGHFIVYSELLTELLAEIMGRSTGVCGGRGGSQHLCYRRFRSNGIQGGICPVAVGGALAIRDEGAVAVAFLGDGTMGEGAVYESLNFAAAFGAPILFVVEDNGIAQTTPAELVVAGSISERAMPFGIRSFAYEGADPLAIHEVASKAIDYVRLESRPAWLHIRTQRMGPHSKGDDTRPHEQIAIARKYDPIASMRPSIEDFEAIERACLEAVDHAVNLASAAPPATL